MTGGLDCRARRGRRWRSTRVVTVVVAFLAAALFCAHAEAATYTVGTTADNTGACASPASGTCSLRQLINFENGLASNHTPADTIVVPANFYSLTNGVLTIMQNVSIAGAGARTTYIFQETTSSTSRVFDIQPNANAFLPTVTISGLGIFFGKADSTNGSFGGDVRNTGTLTLSEDEIEDGGASSGGGISNQGGTLTVTHSLIAQNSANSGGADSGGIQNFGPNPTSGTPGTLSVDNSTIYNNTASLGGGVFSWCSGSGANPCATSGTAQNSVTITDSTVVGNDGGTRSTVGGGLLASQGTISLRNSIVSGNTVSSGASSSNCGTSGTGAITSLGHDLESGSDCGFTATGDLRNTNPKFFTGGTADNGGNTDTLALDASSPVVDAIPLNASGCSGTDQRDFSRAQGKGCDIGAYELFQAVAGKQFSTVLGSIEAGAAASIDWGDGTAQSTGTTDSSTGQVTGTHTYASPGIYSGVIHYNNSDHVASTRAFQIKAASQVSGVTVTNSAPSAAAGARTVYTVGFTASSTGGLSQAGGSQITVTFPQGTDLSKVFTSSVRDTSTNTQVGSCNVSGVTATCSLFSGASTNPGDALSVTLNEVINPTAGAAYIASVSTTADPTPAGSARYSVVTAQAITQPTVTNSAPSAAAGARTVYTVGFTASSTGGLSQAGGSQITVTFPQGTDLSKVFTSSVRDTSTNTLVGSCNASGLTATCSLFSGASTNPGDNLTVTLNEVINPTTVASNYTVSVSTTSDPTAVTSQNYSVVSAHTITQPTVTNSAPSAAAGARTVYTVGFTASSTGGLSQAGGSQITVTFPQGTDLSKVFTSSVRDTSTNTLVGSCNASGLTATCSLFSGASTNPGDNLTVTLNEVINPTTVASNYTVSVSTTSDPTAVTSQNYSVVSAHTITQPTVTNSAPSAAAGARTVYTVGFTASSTGGLSQAGGSQITVTFPQGTDLSKVFASSVRDTSTNTLVGSCNASGLTATCSLFSGASTNPGDNLTVTLNEVINPTTVASNYTVSVSTTSDPTAVTSQNYSVVSAHTITQPTVTPSSRAPGATGATYTIGFTASSTGGLSQVGGSQITITFPQGTAVALTSSSVRDTTANNSLVGSCNASGLTATCGFFSGAATGPGDALSVVLVGLTNPPTASSYTVSVATTSDTGTVSSAPYALAQPPAITNVSPTHGPAAGDTPITITGTNLTGATGVNFGNAPATNVQAVNATTVTAHSPAGAGQVPVTVVTPGGTSNSVQYSYDAPTVTSVAPTHGPASGGTSVTISGSNFTGATGVSFGNAAATQVHVVNDGSITATSPAGAARSRSRLRRRAGQATAMFPTPTTRSRTQAPRSRRLSPRSHRRPRTARRRLWPGR